MLRVSWKMLVGDTSKYLGILFSLAFTTLLITQQGATLLGILSSTTSFVDNIGGVDLWVVDPRVQNVDDIKALTDTQVDRVRSIPGVAWAVPLYKGTTKARMPDGTSENCQIIGLDDATLIGGPTVLLSGRLTDLRNADAVLIDDDAARGKLAQSGTGGQLRPAGIGTTFELNDHRATVVGTYRGQRNFQSQPVIYTTYNRAKSILPNERKMLSYVLVRLQPGVEVTTVQALVRQSTGLRAYTSQEFSAASLSYFIQNTGVIMNVGLSAVMAFLIGGGIAGMTFYNFMLDNQRYFAVLRAMGTRDRTMIGMVTLQAVGVTIIGFGLGIGGVAVLLRFVMANSEISMTLSWPLLGAVGAIVVLVGAVAGTAGLLRVLRTDPAVVFK
ncbi:ABC transporter permease [Roseomonas sp. GC11]|uniref:ABC transporter permease n=1 Tax=Roseomonas sp. GC11 TaxID=2950546 RepID=UPI00210B7B1A|nr:ABC transporter permease [Roseomonas sp. GC11]MCQ4160998.1 ABC transporter permease [Roseomonas sp. GC11]